MNRNQEAFFELVRAGLWEKEARLSQYKDIDFSAIIQLAEEQSVVGLVTAGIENVIDVKVPKDILLTFVGRTLQIEQQNLAVNEQVAWVIDLLRKKDIYTLLVKGQGVAQCYERPLWRSSGDIDLLFNDKSYEEAKQVLTPLAINVGNEYKTFKHIGMTMQSGVVLELHGTLHTRLSKRVDRIVDSVQRDVFYGGNVRSWKNGNTQVFLPAPDNDVFFVFTHNLHHFFIDGVGLRQICDWCRLLWTYKGQINNNLLEKWLKKAGLMSEWCAFAALAVEWLGMPLEAIPLYSGNIKWYRKAVRVIDFVLLTGNLGHNRLIKWSGNRLAKKIQSGWRKTSDMYRMSKVFPLDSFKFLVHFMKQGIWNTIISE